MKYEKRLIFAINKAKETSGDEKERWLVVAQTYSHLIKCSLSHRDKIYCQKHKLKMCDSL